MNGPSGGTLTVLFTDLVSSTELLEQLGDEGADRVRRAHFRLVRSAVAARGGHEVKTMGDGLMVVFQSALDAVSCAVAVQQAVHAHNQLESTDVKLSVRAGLESGEPIRNEGDYFGTPVVVAKRLCDSADGGQILVSETIRNLVGSRGAHAFTPLGARELKGFSETMHVAEVNWEPTPLPEGLDAPNPELRPMPLLRSELTAFVGRHTELEQLERSWSQVLDGERRLVMLSGDAGIGKTRLATEFVVRHAEGGAQILFGRADDHSRIACQPFKEAVEGYMASRGTTELRNELGAAYESALAATQLFQEVATAGERASADGALRQRLNEALIAMFTSARFGSGTVLVLDDLHWADTITIDVLRGIMRTPQQSRLLIIGTFRESDVSRDHELTALLTELRRERLVEVLPIGGLEEQHVGSLVGVWAGQDSPPELTRALYEQTEGNPFFVEETLRHLSGSGAMFDRDGRLRSYANAAGVPETVKGTIERRLARLTDSCMSVLTIASVIGREFGIDALRRASGMAEEQLVAELEEAVDALLIREVRGAIGRYRFAHALVHETLYDALTTTRRVRLHGQTLQYADNDGVKLAYEVLGSRGPFFTVIGVSNCPAVRTRNWTTAQRWQQLSRIGRVLLYDRRGVGMSSTPERGYSMFAGVEDIRAVLDAAGVERTILWGATDGGPMAIAFAALYPERVAGLLLLGTTAKYVASDDYPHGVAQDAVASFLRASDVDRARAISDLSGIRQGSPSGGEAPQAIAEVLQRVPRESWRKLVLGVGGADARSYLSQVKAPTLIIHDPNNAYISIQAAHYLHEHIEHSRLFVTEEWGQPLLGGNVWKTIEDFCQELVT